jgi:photosystem II stability/assembly factor-like uncharacterized protein
VSEDMRTWSTRSTVSLLSFAVDPEQPERIVGAGAGGVVISTDDGATWQPATAPPLGVLTWSAAGELWGVEKSGTVHHSTDGATWRRAGALPGEPQALLATDDDLYAAAHDQDGRTAIYRSIDDGHTWHVRYRDPSQ